MEASLPVLSRVVMASVAMLRFWSAISVSMSMLQLVTAMGCDIATWGVGGGAGGWWFGKGWMVGG